MEIFRVLKAKWTTIPRNLWRSSPVSSYAATLTLLGSCSLISLASLYLRRLCIQRCQLSWIVTPSQVGQSFPDLARSWRPCLRV